MSENKGTKTGTDKTTISTGSTTLCMDSVSAPKVVIKKPESKPK